MMLNNPDLDMITIINCSTCMNAVVGMDPRISKRTMNDAIRAGCIPVFTSTMCNNCFSKFRRTEGIAIPDNIPIAVSMILACSTYNRFVNTFGVLPFVAGGAVHLIRHPDDVAHSMTNDYEVYTVIQEGMSDLSLVKYEEGDFF